jgi:predicted DNA-binding transcriptional regulator AlpA
VKINHLKALVNYHNFEKLLLSEFETFKTENNFKADSLRDLTKNNIQAFKSYFFLRQNSIKEGLISDLKDYILSDEAVNIDTIINSLEGLKKQIDIWRIKIGQEVNLKSDSSQANWKIYAYELFFIYCESFEKLILELIVFIEKQTGRKVEVFSTFKPSEKKFFPQNEISKSDSELMTRNEVADYLRVTPRQVINLENSGYFPRTNTIGGRSVRYLKKDIENYAKGKS